MNILVSSFFRPTLIDKFQFSYAPLNCLNNMMGETQIKGACASVNRTACDKCFPESPCVNTSIDTSDTYVPASHQIYCGSICAFADICFTPDVGCMEDGSFRPELSAFCNYVTSSSSCALCAIGQRCRGKMPFCTWCSGFLESCILGTSNVTSCDTVNEECLKCRDEDFDTTLISGEPYDAESKSFFCGEGGEQLGCSRFAACFGTAGACSVDGTIDFETYPECRGAQPCGTCNMDSPCGVRGSESLGGSDVAPSTFVATEACLASSSAGVCAAAGACFDTGCSDGVFLTKGEFFMTCSAVSACAACFPYSKCGIPIYNTTKYESRNGPWKISNDASLHCSSCAKFSNCYHLGCISGTMLDAGMFQYCKDAPIQDCGRCFPQSPCGFGSVIDDSTSLIVAASLPEAFVAPSSTCTESHVTFGCQAASPCFQEECALIIKQDVCQPALSCAGCFPNSKCSIFEPAIAASEPSSHWLFTGQNDEGCDANLAEICPEAATTFRYYCFKGKIDRFNTLFDWICAPCFQNSPCKSVYANMLDSAESATGQFVGPSPHCPRGHRGAHVRCEREAPCFVEGIGCSNGKFIGEFAHMCSYLCAGCFPHSTCGHIELERAAMVEQFDVGESFDCRPSRGWSNEIVIVMSILSSALAKNDNLPQLISIPLFDNLIHWYIPGDKSLRLNSHALFENPHYRIKSYSYISRYVESSPGKMLTFIASASKADPRLKWIPGTIEKMKSDGIDGLVLSMEESQTLDYWTNHLGFPKSRAAIWLQALPYMHEVVSAELPPSLDICSSGYGSATDIYLDFELIDIRSVDDKLYTFEVVFERTLSWVDDRLKLNSQAIAGSMPKKSDACNAPCSFGGCCDNSWTPRIAIENLVQEKDISVDAKALSFPRDFEGGRIFHKLSATILNPLQFHDFPNDIQTLNVTFSSNTKSRVDFRTVRLLLRNLNVNRTAPIVGRGAWQILRVETFSSDSSAPSNVIFRNSSDISASTVTISIVVKRLPDYFLYNVVLPMFLLNMCGAFTILLPPTEVSDRVMASVTIILAFIAFQYVIKESIPETGYQTRLHSLLSWAQDIVFLVLAESILIFYIHKWLSRLSEKAKRVAKKVKRNFKGMTFRQRVNKAVASAFQQSTSPEDKYIQGAQTKARAPLSDAYAVPTKVHPFNDSSSSEEDKNGTSGAIMGDDDAKKKCVTFDITSNSHASEEEKEEKGPTREHSVTLRGAAQAVRAATRLKKMSNTKGVLKGFFTWDIYFFFVVAAGTVALYALFVLEII